jgi:2-polyprenyl-3-methyl-5-hydroxy-6-metoxy-1,4-benzoquinol methylase|tara:strand:+ start:2064 stop:2834 length:771 start_codon:yes stop_codon:yes gene_type:complete
MKKVAYDEMFQAEKKHWWYLGLHSLVLQLSHQLFSEKSLRILDVGCGTGGLLSMMASNGHEVQGVDSSEDALSHCRNRGINNLFQADLNDWNPGPGYYDLITCMDVLYHDWIHNEVRVLRSLAFGLNKGGVIMLNLPAFQMLSRKHDKMVMLRSRYTKKKLQKILNAANLSSILLTYRLPHAFPVLVLRRIIDVLTPGSTVPQSDVAYIPPLAINQALYTLNQLENRIISHGYSLPFGTSVFAVATNSGSDSVIQI